MKVAKIVWITVGTRVIVDANASESEIWRQCKERLSDNLLGYGNESMEIYDDSEMPYNPSFDD